MDWFLGCSLAYVLGGVPFGLVLVRLFTGVDIRSIGSGNVGATNASRAFPSRLRLPVFFLIYVLDFAKGFVPAWFFAGWLGLGGGLAPVVFGVCAVVGHCASPFLKLRGGKGVATTTGVFAALEFVPLCIALAAFGVVLAATRKVYVGSLAIGITLALSVVLRDPDTAFDERLPVSIAAIATALFLFWTHRSNLRGSSTPSQAADGATTS